MRSRHDDYGPVDCDLPCDLCGIEAGACECPACPICGVAGRKECLKEHLVPAVRRLTALRNFSRRNRQRCESPEGFNHQLNSWSLSDWMTATLGELGEAANVVKKLNRVRDGIPGNTLTEVQLCEQLKEELADTACYLDLLAQAAGFDLEEIREAKFQKVSQRMGYFEEQESAT